MKHPVKLRHLSMKLAGLALLAAVLVLNGCRGGDSGGSDHSDDSPHPHPHPH